MSTKVDLEGCYAQHFTKFDQDSSHLASFFQKTLGVRNWNWKDIVDEIKALPSANANDLDKVVILYTCLERISSSAVSTTELRKEALNNNHNYDGLETFFLHILGVPEMTVQTLYDKLRDPEAALSVDEARRDLIAFSALLQGAKDVMDSSPVFCNAIFPVTIPDASPQLLSGLQDFAIADRRTLEADFRNKAKLLAFSMDEVRCLQPFLKWIGLEHRYLSRMVKEIFYADKTSTRPISQPNRDIRLKAHALLRIAVVFDSPRAVNTEEAFYSLLRSCETFETDSIITLLQLPQGLGKPIIVEKTNGIALQIDDGQDSLKIFVPRRKRDREACFHSKLPQHLFEWMMCYPTKRVPIEGVKAVQAVLTASSCALSDILDESGISSVSIPRKEGEDSDEEEEESDEAAVSDEEKVAGDVEGVVSDEEEALSNEEEEESDEQALTNHGKDTATPPKSQSGGQNATQADASSQAEPNSEQRLSRQPAVSELEEVKYMILILQVMFSATQSNFPSGGSFDMSGVQAALPETLEDSFQSNSPFILRSSSQLESHKRIGVAGEVFVFELLSHLNPALPGFGRPNWKSTIRDYKTIYDDCNDMKPWGEKEEADIMYEDVTGAFTSLLADSGYLGTWDAHTIRQARPEYFIDVKSTTGPFETPFFMSKAQYRKMKDYSQSNRAGSRVAQTLLAYT
ncbi:hypothetical protein B0T10DRAFT_587961 [Thelonectria olida]|uniref:Uncharacterized protein n=1 Tax=Thelonectria olida TaxID=1576542 RepID=A0A9P8VRM5_9HYPO|nr:hypothetical protein B0T10DRAFT_587961 [Thelonectria olida]